jgi:hypothetical protein
MAVAESRSALMLPARRLLNVAGNDAEPGGEVAAVRRQWSHNGALLSVLATAAEAQAAFAAGDNPAPALRALADWQGAANAVIEDILGSVVGYLAAE